MSLDTGHDFEIAPGSVPAGLPAVGEVVPEPVLRALALAAERKQVARAVFAQLDRRLQPVARLRDRLQEQGYGDEAIADVLGQLAAKGIHSDRRYAEAFCRDRLLGRAVGRRYLVQKLREKRVDPGLAGEVAAEILDDDTEAELALAAAAARWARLRGANDQRALAKVVRFLIGRGFGPGVAQTAARRTRPAAAADS
ncbi:RecX family transcriptional regulator [bacterium]|nr:RecX family transcriptional regulator [bacterium]